MFKSLDFTNTGGVLFCQEVLDFLQQAYSDTLSAVAKQYGDKVIVSGLTDVGGGAVSDGWVSLSGELIPVTGGTVQAYLHLDTAITNEQYADGSSQPFYTNKTMSFSAVASGNYAYSDFKRLPFGITGTLLEVLKNLQSIVNGLVFGEPVILNGCTLSNVDDVASTCKISAGTSYIDGKTIYNAQYTGSYPVWLNSSGNFVSSQPGSGGYIKFDYETSQRYADVLKRNTHGSGEIVMSRSSDDLALFDAATGLGKWKWLGWKLCDVMQSRMAIGYDRRTSNPGGADTDVWSASNHTLNNTGGSRTKTLAKFNLPNIQLNVPIPASATSKTDTDHGRIVMGNDDTDSDGPTLKTEALGSGTAFDVMNPNRVILYIEKI